MNDEPQSLKTCGNTAHIMIPEGRANRQPPTANRPAGNFKFQISNFKLKIRPPSTVHRPPPTANRQPPTAPMSRRTWLLITLLIIAIEGGVLGWRYVTLKPSTAPVFYWKGAELVTSAPPPFGKALELYQADRGAEENASLPDGRRIMIFYFEWDSITMGPFVAAGGHRADVCNVAAGFKLLQSGGHRDYRFTNGETLRFNYTLLAEKTGKQVYVYKVPWIQGFGELVSTSEDNRTSRFRRSFLHHRGAARVLQAGIFGAASEDEAWAMFQREVLAKVEWQPALRPR